jgi:hypothetical protein
MRKPKKPGRTKAKPPRSKTTACILGMVVLIFAVSDWFVLSAPKVKPDPAISSSWEAIPIQVKNQNEVFDMRDLKVFETVENVTFAGKQHQFRIGEQPEHLMDITAQGIKAGESVNIPCEVFKEIQMRDPDNNREYMPVDLIQLRFRIAYSVFGLRMEKISPSFTLGAVSGGYQWFKNDVSDALN